jgi:organic hydroperoxide reductase OsmC/OhrA
MSTHVVDVIWQARDGDEFLAGRYSRAHTLRFDGGAVVAGSPSPSVVPAPWSDAAAVDPEEMFVAALSSCHMLWFLDFARRAKIEIRSYRDRAEGVMAKNDEGRIAITRVALRPRIDSDADRATLEDLHHKAHAACFIANSVKCEIVVEPQTESEGKEADHV